MTPLLSNTEPCHFCAAPIEITKVENGLVPVDDFGDAYCNAECLANHEERQNERAYERFCEAFYGGGVETQQEQYQKAWEEKRRLRR